MKPWMAMRQAATLRLHWGNRRPHLLSCNAYTFGERNETHISWNPGVSMIATEWAEELADTLAHQGHGLAQMTLASYKDAPGRDEVIETANNVAAMAGWPVCTVSVMSVEPDPSVLPDTGFVVLRDVDIPLPTAVTVLVGAFQLLVQRDLPVVLLVVGTKRGIKALRLHPGMGFLSRAESVIQT